MLAEKQPCCYMMASQKNGTLYIGVTSDLMRRVHEHKSGIVQGFTTQHNIKQLVWYQLYPAMEDAIRKEKQLKKWERLWKLRLIESKNPEWADLYPGLLGESVLLDSRLRGNDGSNFDRNDAQENNRASLDCYYAQGNSEASLGCNNAQQNDRGFGDKEKPEKQNSYFLSLANTK